jgi:hypothetical protein
VVTGTGRILYQLKYIWNPFGQEAQITHEEHFDLFQANSLAHQQ